MKWRVILLLALTGFFAGHARVAAEDWPCWRGPNANGISSEKGWQTAWSTEGPKQLWKASVGQGYSSMSVSRARLYTMGVVNGQETVSCLDAETGKLIWQQHYPYVFEPKYYDGGSSATPTVNGNFVYTLGQSGELNCYDAGAGNVVWFKNIQKELGVKLGTWGFASSPLVEGDLLILNVGSFGTAITKATGKVVWTTGKEANGYSSAVPYSLGGRRAIALLSAKAVVGVDVKTGQELWRFPWKTDYEANVADPIVAGDEAFVSSSYGTGCALIQFSTPPPKVIWKNKHLMNHFNSSVLLDGFLYGVSGEADKFAEFQCLDWKTGDLKWTEKGLGLGGFMVADRKLIILSEKGELVIAEASPQAFKPLARTQVLGGKSWTTPVLANGRIYCRNSRGDLVCVDVRPR